MKKLKLTNEEFIKQVVNYMLREYDADYDYVNKNPIIKGVNWFEYYWDTPESKQQFNKWLYKFIEKNVDYGLHEIDKIIGVINMMYGLKVYDNDSIKK